MKILNDGATWLRVTWRYLGSTENGSLELAPGEFWIVPPSRDGSDLELRSWPVNAGREIEQLERQMQLDAKRLAVLKGRS